MQKFSFIKFLGSSTDHCYETSSYTSWAFHYPLLSLGQPSLILGKYFYVNFKGALPMKIASILVKWKVVLLCSANTRPRMMTFQFSWHFSHTYTTRLLYKCCLGQSDVHSIRRIEIGNFSLGKMAILSDNWSSKLTKCPASQCAPYFLPRSKTTPHINFYCNLLEC